MENTVTWTELLQFVTMLIALIALMIKIYQNKN